MLSATPTLNKEFIIIIIINKLKPYQNLTYLFHISYLNFSRRVALRQKPFFKGPSGKKLNYSIQLNLNMTRIKKNHTLKAYLQLYNIYNRNEKSTLYQFLKTIQGGCCL